MYLKLSISYHDATYSAGGRNPHFENALGSQGRPGVCLDGSSTCGQRLQCG